MKQIDKDALVAEIDRRIKETESMLPKFDQFWAEQISAFKGVLKILDTLEVKKVDFDKMLTEFMGRYAYENGGEYPSAIDIAKHFFELGLKAQKGE